MILSVLFLNRMNNILLHLSEAETVDNDIISYFSNK